jgi:hypothetical protein
MYSSTGAAISTMLCEGLQVVFMGYYLRGLVRVKAELYLPVTILATAVMGGFIFWVKTLPYDISRPELLSSVIFLSVIIYLGIVFMFKVFKVEEVKKLLRT